MKRLSSKHTKIHQIQPNAKIRVNILSRRSCRRMPANQLIRPMRNSSLRPGEAGADSFLASRPQLTTTESEEKSEK
jgi:hypothetical protein